MSATRHDGSSDKRAATTAPADPAPTTTKSYESAITHGSAPLIRAAQSVTNRVPDAASLSPELQVMIGYKMNGALGFHDPRLRAESLSPTASVAEAQSVS